MARKTVSLSESAYNELNDEKQDGESFSDTVKRLANEPEPMPLTADDISLIATQTAEEVENRMTHK